LSEIKTLAEAVDVLQKLETLHDAVSKYIFVLRGKTLQDEKEIEIFETGISLLRLLAKNDTKQGAEAERLLGIMRARVTKERQEIDEMNEVGRYLVSVKNRIEQAFKMKPAFPFKPEELAKIKKKSA